MTQGQLSFVPTEVLVAELHSRYEAAIVVGYLNNEITQQMRGATVLHSHGANLSCLGLATLAVDHFRNVCRIGQPMPPGGIY